MIKNKEEIILKKWKNFILINLKSEMVRLNNKKELKYVGCNSIK